MSSSSRICLLSTKVVVEDARQTKRIADIGIFTFDVACSDVSIAVDQRTIACAYLEIDSCRQSCMVGRLN